MKLVARLHALNAQDKHSEFFNSKATERSSPNDEAQPHKKQSGPAKGLCFNKPIARMPCTPRNRLKALHRAREGTALVQWQPTSKLV